MSGLLLSSMMSGMGQGLQQGLGQWQTLIGQRMLLKDNEEMATARQERGFQHAEKLQGESFKHAEGLQKETIDAQRAMNQERIGASIAEKGMDVNQRNKEHGDVVDLKREELKQTKGLKERELGILEGRNKIYEQIARAKGVAADAKAGPTIDREFLKTMLGKDLEGWNSVRTEAAKIGDKDLMQEANNAIEKIKNEGRGVAGVTSPSTQEPQPINPWMTKPGAGQGGALQAPMKGE